MDNINSILGENIRKFRKEVNLTQEELADKIGVTYQAVSKWENAQSAPDVSFLPMLADLFGCSIDDLFSYTSKQSGGYPNFDWNLNDMDDVPEDVRAMVINQLRRNMGKGSAHDKYLSIIAENVEGKFEWNKENIDRYLDAFGDLLREHMPNK